MALGISDHVGTGTARLGEPPAATTVEELQRHIARELHDQVAQPLVGLLFEIREHSSTHAELAGLEEAARKILRDVRGMMVDLREKTEPGISLQRALKNELRTPSGRNIVLQATSRWPQHINRWVALNLLRIVQQAVANAWRHGRAEEVRVILDVGPADEAVVVVTDDGVGVGDSPDGFGMLGMRERAAILGATLIVEPREPRGTRIEVRLPVASLS